MFQLRSASKCQNRSVVFSGWNHVYLKVLPYIRPVEKCWDEPKEHCTKTTHHCFFRSVFRRGLAMRLPRECTKKILPKTGARKTVLPVASEAIRCWPMLRRVVTFRRLSKTF